MESVQDKRASFRHLRNVLAHAQAKRTAAKQRYKTDFDRKMGSRRVRNVGNYVCVDRSFRTFTEEERRKVRHTDDKAIDASRELLARPEGLYQVQSATDAVVQDLPDSVATMVSVDGVTKVPNGL